MTQGGAFEADWLALRAGADAEARDPELFQSAVAWARRGGVVVDLGCGAGALAAAIAEAAPSARFRLVDGDPALLARAEARLGARGDAVAVDLNAPGGLETAVADADLIVASAFFDLVSTSWIDRLVAAIPRSAAVYAGLSYDGRQIWSPAHAADAAVVDAFNRHQRSDKGFGRSAGPDAGAVLASALAAVGRPTRVATSDWRLAPARAPRDAALTRALAAGAAEAAAEMGVDVDGWAGVARERVAIGHIDVWSPPASATL